MNPSVNIHQISRIVSQKVIKRKRVRSKASQNDQEYYENIKDKLENDDQKESNKIMGIVNL